MNIKKQVREILGVGEHIKRCNNMGLLCACTQSAYLSTRLLVIEHKEDFRLVLYTSSVEKFCTVCRKEAALWTNSGLHVCLGGGYQDMFTTYYYDVPYENILRVAEVNEHLKQITETVNNYRLGMI